MGELVKTDAKYNETFLAIQRYWFDQSGKIELSKEHEKVLERWTYADRLIRMEYIHEQNVPAHLIKHFGISRSTAFEDIRHAKKIFGAVSMEDQVYYSSIHYSYALEEFKKAQRRRDTNGAAKFLNLMQVIKTQMSDGMSDKMLALAKQVESMQIMVVVDDPAKVGLKSYSEEDKKRLFNELLNSKTEDVEYDEVK